MAKTRMIPVDGAIRVYEDLRAVVEADPDPDDPEELARVDLALFTLEMAGRW